jgi:hypothetical protein
MPKGVIPQALAMYVLEHPNRRREELETMISALTMAAVRVSSSLRRYTSRPVSTGLAHKVIRQLRT